MKQLMLGLGVAMLCGNTATAEDVSWTCKAPRTQSQFTVFADKVVQITKKGDVFNYTCKTGFCVNYYENSELKFTSHETIELLYSPESIQADIKEPRAFRQRFYARLSSGEILIPPDLEDIQTLRCEKL